MAGATDKFEFIRVEEIKFKFVPLEGETRSERVSAGIYKATASVYGNRTDEWNKVVFIPLQNYLTLHTLRSRLEDPKLRQSDFKALQENGSATPFELWSQRGSEAKIPRNLVVYDPKQALSYSKELDEMQLKFWGKMAKGLGGKPSENPLLARFSLRPSDDLKTKAGNELVYCSPAQSPAFRVTKDKLKAIIAANTGKFDGWPDPVVVDFKTAQDTLGLKLVGRNFLQFYFTWMKPSYYAELWEQHKVTKLLHALPAKRAKKKTYQNIDDTMTAKESRSEMEVDGIQTPIVVRKSDKRKDIMGKSATEVAAKLWGNKYITSGMGGSVKVEWLHRMALSLNGLNVFKNFIFGTWECNTDMIRAENFIKELARGQESQGLLTTKNKSGTFFRPNTLGEAMEVTIPSWATNYSWLCFSLKYRYELNADECPLDGPVAHDIDFDPWSIYVPLSMEPRLDSYILENLKSGGCSAQVVPPSVSSISNKAKKRRSGANSGKAVSPVPSSVSNTTKKEKPGASSGKLASTDPSNVFNMAIPQPLGPTYLGAISFKHTTECALPQYSTLAWNAAINGLLSVDLPDIVVKDPTVAIPPVPDDVLADGSIVHHSSRSKCSIPVDTPVPKGGFVLQGEVNLFGTRVAGNIEKWMGPAPGDVVIGMDPPLIERVDIRGDFHLSQLIPLLDGTPFDNIIFRNVAIFYQNYAFDKTRSIGWHFNADWVIDSSCGLLHNILRTVLQVDQPILSIHATFGKSLQWSVPLNLQSFILEGVFPNLTLSPVSGLTLTSIGVRLLGIRGFSFTPQPHSTLSFGFGVFGTMKLAVPGSVVPLNLDYEMGLVGNMVTLRAEISGSIWEDALGVEGLLLNDVVFGTSFSVSSPLKTFAFDVSATFSYLSSVAYLQGSYAASGHFTLTAELDNFGINELNDFFFALFGDFLTLPDFDVHIGSAIVSIASGQGLSISLLDVTIAGYTAVSVKVTLSPSGASLSGELSSSTIPFGDVELREALIKLAFWTTDKKKVDLMLGGKLRVDFLDLEVGAAVHLYPGKAGVEWAVVAELSAPSRPFAISDVVPAVKDTFVDFSLRNAVIIAASQDDPSIGQSFPGYRVRNGVQVFGVIDRIEALNKLLRQEVKGLVFNAGWSKASGFRLLISLPVESSIDLGNGIKTTPITLGIRTSPIQLAIDAGITVRVKDSTPLDFSFVLAANAIGASASVQMRNWWVKPFGVDNLKIGPEVTLSIEIIYAQFVTTGLPSGFGVSGGLQIGTVPAFLAVNISEDPRRQLLYGKIENLDISHVVQFAGTLVDQAIPQIPDNLLKFKEIQVYVCPFGVVLGQTVYPQGFSFKADLLVFGKRANIECTIDKVEKSVDIVGGIDNFELGPLTVRGSKGPRATLECHIGVSKQQLIVDGVVGIFDVQAQTYINIQFLPDPKFKFYLMLKWVDIFMLKLDAELLGSIRDQLSEADFKFYAELENHILDYVTEQIIEQFEAAKVTATHGLEVAQMKVIEAQEQWQKAIDDAQREVDGAQKKWESYERDIRGSSQPVIDNYLSNISRLQGEIDVARKEYEKAMDDAERAVNQANQDRASALASAQCDVENARRDMNNEMNDAQRELDNAKAELSRAFGNAQRDIDNAQQEVWSLNNQINDIKRTISEYEDAPWYEFHLKTAIAGLWIAVGMLETSKAIAGGVLDAARAILTGSEYIAKEGAVEAAKKAVDVASSTGHFGLSTAQGVLHLADETSKAAVDAAEATLEGVKQGGKYVAFESAKGALEGFKQTNEAAYEGAMAAIKGLMDCADFIAFNTAKAGLEVAKGSTKILDAAKEALVLAEEASKAALSVLEEIVRVAARAFNIETIILSGTLRGVLGIGGRTARPLRAIIKGYIGGRWFDIEAEFDPREPVKFITATFKKLWYRVWELLVSAEQPHVADREADTIQGIQPLAFDRNTIQGIHPQPFLAAMHDINQPVRLLTASSSFLEQRPDVLKMLTYESESIPTGIPHGPFSGRPIVSSAVVDRHALILMREARGISVFVDCQDVPEDCQDKSCPYVHWRKSGVRSRSRMDGGRRPSSYGARTGPYHLSVGDDHGFEDGLELECDIARGGSVKY